MTAVTQRPFDISALPIGAVFAVPHGTFGISGAPPQIVPPLDGGEVFEKEAFSAAPPQPRVAIDTTKVLIERRVTRQELIAEGNLYEFPGMYEAPSVMPPSRAPFEVLPAQELLAAGQSAEQVVVQGGLRSWTTYGDIIQPQAPVMQSSDRYVSYASEPLDNYMAVPSAAPTTYVPYAYERVQEPVATTIYAATQPAYSVQEQALEAFVAPQAPVMYELPDQIATSTFVGAPTQSMYVVQEPPIPNTTFDAPQTQVIYDAPPTMPAPAPYEALPTMPPMVQGPTDAFDMVDSNHDGVISQQEWAQATGTTYLQPVNN